MFQLTPAVSRLLLINIVMFALPYALMAVAPGLERTILTVEMLLGLHLPGTENFYFWQFFTYMFMHSGFWHLFSNMFGVMVFGPLLESALGIKRFLMLYFITGLGAGAIYLGTTAVEVHFVKQQADRVLLAPTADNVAQFMSQNDPLQYRVNLEWITSFSKSEGVALEGYQQEAMAYVQNFARKAENSTMVGASGALMGILIAFGLLFPNTELMLLFPPIPIKAKYIVAAYAAYDVFRVFQDAPDDNVAHYAHLGGMVFGWGLIEYWKRQRNTFY